MEVTNLDGEMLYVGMSGQIINTLLYAGVGGFLATFIPCLTAYLTAKFPCKLSSAVNIIVVVTMILPIDRRLSVRDTTAPRDEPIR